MWLTGLKAPTNTSALAYTHWKKEEAANFPVIMYTNYVLSQTGNSLSPYEDQLHRVYFTPAGPSCGGKLRQRHETGPPHDLQSRHTTEGSGLPSSRVLQPIRTPQLIFRAKNPKCARHGFPTSCSTATERKTGGF